MLKRLFRLLAPAALLLWAAPPVFAFDFDRGVKLPLPDSFKETPAVPVSSPTPVSNDLLRFWENLKTDTIDGVCRSAEVKLNKEGKLENGPGIMGEFKRYLRRDPQGRLFLVDEVKVDLFSDSVFEAFAIPDLGPVNVNFGARLSGQSVAVQPLDHDRYCKELGTLAKLWKVKTVIPPSAKRISEMKVGEIWKLPLSIRMNFGLGAGVPVSPMVSVSVSGGVSGENRYAVTLRRLTDRQVRLRLRLEKVEVFSGGAAVTSVAIPMEQLGLLEGENLIAREVNRAWAREVNNYIAAKLSFGLSRTLGRRLLLEYVLDPSDPAQLAGLEKFLKGDWGVLRRFAELGLCLDNISEDGEAASGTGELNAAAANAGGALGAGASFAGSDAYHSNSHSFNIQVPVIHKHDSSWTSSYNRYQSLDNGGEALHVRQETRVSNGSSIDVPFMGKLFKGDSQQSVYVVNREGADGSVSGPVFMYQQMEGQVRHSEGSARGMVEEANGVLRYVGMGGMGSDPAHSVPVNLLFPQPPAQPHQYGYDDTYSYHDPSVTYHSALMSFKLLISERGVAGVLNAPVRTIMLSFLNMMCEKYGHIIAKIWRFFDAGADGKVTYDANAVRKALGLGGFESYDNPTEDPMTTVYFLARDAGRVIADFASVRNAGGWKARSDRLAKIAAGDSKSGLKYGDFLKVMVQLVNPADISASVFVHTDKRVKGQQDVTQDFRFFNGRENDFDATLSGVSAMRERFAEPSTLSD